MDRNKIETGELQDIADHINKRYAEAILPLLEQRNEIDRELAGIDEEADRESRRFDIMMRYPFPDQVELVARRAGINKQIRAYQSQDQERDWIREYKEGTCMSQ